jgi:DNA-directed RNA polymerase subunit N (RpoN/RPB10)
MMRYVSLLAYIAGVLKGDGWYTDTIGLRVKDKDFAEAFACAMECTFNVIIKPRLEAGKYWCVRKSCKNGAYQEAVNYTPSSDREIALWLRGLFDSEGNACLHKLKAWENSYHRKVAMYSTNIDTVDQAIEYLSRLGIQSCCRKMKLSKGHLGIKPVYEIRLRDGKDNFGKFAELIGSSIQRKQATIEAIVSTYKPDISQHCREIQLKGAASKKRRTMEATLPKVIEGVRELIAQGVKPTQRACRCIPGYNSIQGYIPQAELVGMALRE